MFRIISFFLLFFTSSSQCLNELVSGQLTCYVCDFSHYDINYPTILKLEVDTGSLPIQTNCFLKNSTFLLSRKILILNSLSPSISSFSGFDEIYNDPLTAFQEESKILNSYLYSSVEFNFYAGNHYLLRSLVAIGEEELFRRSLTNIILKPMDPTQNVTLIFKTNEFYLFISKSFSIQNIEFVGNDVLVQNGNDPSQCYNSITESCCLDQDFLNSSNNCFLVNRKINKTQNSVFYGLFNLEYIFDNNDNLDYPHLTIANCSFLNFFPLNSTKGWTTLITMAPLGGSLTINGSLIDNVYFPGGLIFYNRNQYDSLYMIFMSGTNFTNYEMNYQNISISNTIIMNYNQYDIDNSLNNGAFVINLIQFKGNFQFEANIFQQIFNCTYVIYYDGLIDSYSVFNFEDSIFTNMSYVGIFYFNNINELNFQNVSLSSIINDVITMMNFENINNVSLLELSLINISNPLLTTFSLINCQTYLNNSIFLETNQITLVNAQDGLIIVTNCSFQNLIFVNNIFSIIDQNFSLMTNCLFEFINGSVSLLYISGGNVFVLHKTMIKYVNCFSVYYLQNLLLNDNQELFIFSNHLTYFWNTDQTCQNTQMENSSLIENTIQISVFANLGVLNANIMCYQVNILNNIMGIRPIMKIMYGICNLTNITVIGNTYVPPNILHYVFSFESDNIVYISNSIFKDNGFIIRKTVFLAAYEGALINLWSLTYSYLNNNLFVSSSINEIASGFISASPHGGILELYNSKFITLETNPTFEYKGILLDHFVVATVINNTFINLMCNTLSFIHMHGSITFVAASSYSYSENNYVLYMENNQFFNCSCMSGNGGGMGIISIYSVVINNSQFYNSTASGFCGHFLVISGESLIISQIYMNVSSAGDGGAIYLQNFPTVMMDFLEIYNSFARGNGVIFCSNIDNLEFNSSFSQNSVSLMNGGFMYIFLTNSFMKNLTILNSSAQVSGGSFIILGNSQVYLQNCIVAGSSAYMGGVFDIDAATEVVILNISIMNFFSGFAGAAFYVNSINSFQLSNVEMFNGTSLGNGIISCVTDDETVPININNIICNNTSAVEGSCIYFLSSTKFFVNNITIIKNGPIPIYLMWSFEITVVLSNILIGNSNSNNSLFLFSGIQVLINQLNINENTIAGDFLELDNATILVNSINFIKNKGDNAFKSTNSFIFIQDLYFNNYLDDFFTLNLFDIENSGLNLENAQIIQSISPRNSHALVTNGLLNVFNVSFLNNKGLLFDIVGANMSLDNCTFDNNTSLDPSFPNEFYYENIDPLIVLSLKITNGIFSQYLGYSLSLQGGLIIQIMNCSFENLNNQNSSDKIFCLFTQNFQSFNISSCFFSNYTNGALQFYSEINSQYDLSLVDITFSQFTNISGILGSALYFKGSFQIIVSNCNFESNTAVIDPLNKNNMVQGLAACIFFKPEDYQLSNLTLDSNYFINNYAEFASPTVFSQSLTILNNNTFLNNFDAINFTNQVFAYPLQFSLSNTSSTDSIEIASGNTFSLDLELKDSFNNTLIFDNNSIFTLKQNLTKSDNISILLANGLTKAEEGIITFPNLNIKATPNSQFQLILSGAFLGLLNNANDEILQNDLSIELNFFSRPCKIGEIITSDSSCQECLSGTYSLVDPMITAIKFQKCYVCPPNAKCMGGSSICPLPGFYRKYNTSNNVAACVNSKACLGCSLDLSSETEVSDDELINGVCEIGNEGVLCFYCNYNYGKYDATDYCLECASVGTVVIVRLVFYGVLMILYILMNFHMAEQVHKKENDGTSSFSTLLKILINHSQHISIILLSSATIPFPSFNNYFNQNDYFSFSNDQVITNDCIVQRVYFDPQTNVIFKEVFNTILPIAFSIFAFTVWLIITLLMGMSKKFKARLSKIPRSISGFLSKTIIFIVLSTFIFYALIVKSCFGLFDCMSIDQNEDKSFLRESPEIQCWQSSHIRYVLFFGMPGLLIWGMLFPLSLFLILKKNYNFMRMANNSGAESIISRLDQYKAKSVKPNITSKKIALTLNLSTDKQIESRTNNKIQNKKQENESMMIFDTQKMESHDPKDMTSKPSSVNDFEEGKLEELISNLQKSRNGKVLKNDKQKEKFIDNYKQNLEISKTFVFFYKDYKSDFFYWECLIFFRKFILSFFSSLSNTINNEIRLILMLAILFIFFELTRKKQPYKESLCNFIELLSMVVCIISVFSSEVFASESSLIFQYIVAVICIMSNLIFFILTFLLILMKVKAMIQNLVKQWWRVKKNKAKTNSKVISMSQTKKNLMKNKKGSTGHLN